MRKRRPASKARAAAARVAGSPRDKRRRSNEQGQTKGGQLCLSESEPGDLPHAEAELRHQEIVDEQGNQDTDSHAGDTPELTHPRAEKDQAGI